MSKSAIEWTEETWNPVTGCSKVSPGCAHCYAERLALRKLQSYETGLPWTKSNASKNVVLHPDRLEIPLRAKRPRTYFVNSMSDLFHEEIPFHFIDSVFEVMRRASQHTYQVLTKRPARMLEWADSTNANLWIGLRNLWIGVSVEDQKRADERMPLLLEMPAAVHFVSAEPLLGPIDFLPWISQLKWIIVGGESGPGARPMPPVLARSIREQCIEAGVPFFFKQWGEWEFKGTPRTFEDKYAALKEAGSKIIVQEGYFHKTGKKKAGRELDGRTWDEMP